jgi:hypothetical protein
MSGGRCPSRRTKKTSGVRAALVAIAIAALAVMAYGERWMLAQPPGAARAQLIAATYVLDSVYGDTDAADTATGQRVDDEGENE